MNAPMTNKLSAVDNASKERLMEDLRMVVADAEELMKATANQAGEQVSTVRNKASESLRVAKARLAEAQASAVERLKVAAKTPDHYVHDKPWQSVGIAATVGILIGVLIGRQ
jgi:ElaB/YqjD/DUF883 family membrane-anchored ribosome-binding protein